MPYKFLPGEKLMVTLTTDDLIEGEFVASSCNRLDLNNCVGTYSNNKVPGIQYFYASEIKDVHSFKTESSSEEQNTDNHSNDDETASGINQSSKAITIPEEKYTELKLLSKKYIYMATMDARFSDAVDYLASCETIGIAMLSSDLGRSAPIDLLVISSWDQIYLFDILIYNSKHFPQPLKYLLESEDITKVVHDSRGLVDCMHHRHNMKVNNIFDTAVACQMISGKDLLLHQCLGRYFNFPEVMIKEAMDPKLKSKWNKRPLSEDYKKYAAMHVQYLITLKNYFQKELLKDFHHQVRKHSQSTLDSSLLEAQLALGLNININ